MIIPRTMSTQHPDNARMPLFASGKVIGLEDEIKEALWAFSMGIEEQMWDLEGKTALPGVVQELLLKDPDFFKENPLGKKFFLTLRIPNPDVETNDRKLVSQIMMEIPRAFDIAKEFNKKYHGKNFPPVFEVILPMTTSAKQLNLVRSCYQTLISPQKDIVKWLGEFRPKTINIIALLEDMDSQLNAARIIKKFIMENLLEYARVMLARSDPGINYGVWAAVLLVNVAAQRLHKLELETGIPIYVIIGAGDGDRGNFNPLRADSMIKGYPSCQTFTIQSAFKYDHPQHIVAEAVKKINSSKRGEPVPVDEQKSIYLIKKSAAAYQEQIPEVAHLINQINRFVPPRRLRRKHIGLFGYSRNVGGIRLPRAIGVCASLYSIGLPLRLFGLHRLNAADIKLMRKNYPSPNFEEDTRDSFQYFNPDALSLLTPGLRKQILKSLKLVEFDTHLEHKKITAEIIRCYKKQQTDPIFDLIVEAARIRRFLG
jgi:phosphoenolpyruvate carboxylase